MKTENMATHFNQLLSYFVTVFVLILTRVPPANEILELIFMTFG